MSVRDPSLFRPTAGSTLRPPGIERVPHQEKRILHLIRWRCILTHGPDILPPIDPVRPDCRRNVPYVVTQRHNVSYVLTQRRVLPTSRLPEILPLVASSSTLCSLRVISSLRPDVSCPLSPL